MEFMEAMRRKERLRTAPNPRRSQARRPLNVTCREKTASAGVAATRESGESSFWTGLAEPPSEGQWVVFSWATG